MKHQKAGEYNFTTDLELFKSIKGNRSLRPLHIRKIELSIKNHGMLRMPITVNEKMEVIDGQNRLEACKRAECGIFYITCKNYGLREVQVLNENSIVWTKKDYLYSYCELGYSEYIKFKEFWDDFPKIGFSGIERILTLLKGHKNTTIDGNKTSSKYFQSGNLSIPNINKSRQIAKRLVDFSGLFEAWNTPIFISAMLTVFENEKYDHEWFLNRLNLVTGPRLEHQRTVKNYLLNIEEVYNYRLRGENIRFF